MNEREKQLLSLYMIGELTEQDQEEMETLLRSNRQFRADFAGLQVALRRESRRIPIKRINWKKYLLIFGGAIILWVAGRKGYEAWYKPVTPIKMALVYDSYTPLSPFKKMGNDGTTFNNLEPAFSHPQTATPADYDNTLKIIQTYPKQSVSRSDSIAYRFFEGICRIRGSRPDYVGAERIFTEIHLRQKEYAAESLWFLALAYAGQEKWKECETALLQIDATWYNILKVEALLKQARESDKQ